MLALLSEASRPGPGARWSACPPSAWSPPPRSGIALDRLALVPNPGPEWPTVVAALIDGVDVVVTAVPGAVSASIASRLAARARQRGSVLVPYGRWEGADVTLQVTRACGTGSARRRAAALRRGGVGARPAGAGAALPAADGGRAVWMPGRRRPVAPARRPRPPPGGRPCYRERAERTGRAGDRAGADRAAAIAPDGAAAAREAAVDERGDARGAARCWSGARTGR